MSKDKQDHQQIRLKLGGEVVSLDDFAGFASDWGMFLNQANREGVSWRVMKAKIGSIDLLIAPEAEVAYESEKELVFSNVSMAFRHAEQGKPTGLGAKADKALAKATRLASRDRPIEIRVGATNAKPIHICSPYEPPVREVENDWHLVETRAWTCVSGRLHVLSDDLRSEARATAKLMCSSQEKEIKLSVNGVLAETLGDFWRSAVEVEGMARIDQDGISIMEIEVEAIRRVLVYSDEIASFVRGDAEEIPQELLDTLG